MSEAGGIMDSHSDIRKPLEVFGFLFDCGISFLVKIWCTENVQISVGSYLKLNDQLVLQEHYISL